MLRSVKSNNPDEQLLTKPSTIFGNLIADIQRARRSVDAEFYIFASDRTGRAFAELLGRKSRQGLRVRLLVDGFGSRGMSGSMRRQLRNDGVELCFFSRRGNCRNHRKMAIIDGEIAYVGGVNIADRYTVGNHLGTWHDAELRVAGHDALALARLFEYDYDTANGREGRVDVVECGRLGIYWTECGGGGAMQRLFADIVRGAEREIVITTPYFMPPERSFKLMHEAVLRGVEVRVMLPERCDIWAIDDIMHHHIAHAMAVGIDVEVCRHSFLHAKLAVVDRRRVVVGSANLDARSLSVNREIMVSTFHRGVCADAIAFVERLMRLSTPPTSRELRSRMPHFVARMLEPLL